MSEQTNTPVSASRSPSNSLHVIDLFPSTAPPAPSAVASHRPQEVDKLTDESSSTSHGKGAHKGSTGMKRSRSLEVVDIAAMVKKPRGRPAAKNDAVDRPCKSRCRNPKISGQATDSTGTAYKLRNLHAFSDAETQTELQTSEPVQFNATTGNHQKSIAETVSDGMITFTTSVGATINTIHSEVKELQNIIVQLTAEISEMHQLHDTVHQMSVQMAEMRTSMLSTQNNETRDLYAALNLLAVQQTETKELRNSVALTSSQLSELRPLQDAVQQISTQVSALSQTANQPGLTSAPILQCCTAPHTDNSNTAHNSSSTDFPSLPPPSHPRTPLQRDTGRAPVSRNQSQSSNEQLKHEIMSAMYVDMKDKQRRASNIIVSGLKASDVSDKMAVCRLLRAEYPDWSMTELEDAIVDCKRIGRPQADRPQSLLVNMDSSESAAFFIAHATVLRRSRNVDVKNHIFISADLTPSESAAAYEARCRRRQQRNANPVSDSQREQYDHSRSRLIYRSTVPTNISDSVVSNVPHSNNLATTQSVLVTAGPAAQSVDSITTGRPEQQ